MVESTHRTETWFRNPDIYIREFLEADAHRIVWNQAYLDKRKIDPVKFMTLWAPASLHYRMLVIAKDVAQEWRPGDKKPSAVYPVWNFGEDLEFLEAFAVTSWGDDEDLCGDAAVPANERPVLGQEHRVIVANVPLASTGPGKRFLRQLAEIQEENPDCMIHVHGLYSFPACYGLGYNAVDIEPRTTAKKGKVILPNGKEVTYERTALSPQWTTLLGFSPVDLAVPRNRCIYNIKSALWAGEHYMENFKFRTRGSALDPDEDGSPTGGLVHSGKAQPGDKFHCDTCSLQDKCKYFRTGAVCSIPDSEASGLARQFKTRSVDTILDGLGNVLAAQADRLQRGMEEEEEFGELNPEVTRIVNSLVGGGVKLAKLVDPTLNGGPKVGVFVNTGPNGGPQMPLDPKKAVSALVAELEAQGISRDKMTPAMINRLLQPAPASGGAPIDVESSEVA